MRDAPTKLLQDALALACVRRDEVAFGRLHVLATQWSCGNTHGREGPLQVGAPGVVGAHDSDGARVGATGQLVGNRLRDEAYFAGRVGGRFPCAFSRGEGGFKRHALQQRVGLFEFRKARGAGVGREGGAIPGVCRTLADFLGRTYD